MKLTKGIISREEALAISPDYVAYCEGDHDKWEVVNEQFEKARRGQKAITFHDDGKQAVFVRVAVSSVNSDDPRAIDGPVVRVTNGEFSWRVDGDKYAFLIPPSPDKPVKLDHEPAGCCAMGLCGPDAAEAARQASKQAEYHFTVKGVYPNGIKAKLAGRVTAAAPAGKMPPASAFDAAVEVAKDLYPGLAVDQSKSGSVVLRLVK